jgi:hypothetical protein
MYACIVDLPDPMQILQIYRLAYSQVGRCPYHLDISSFHRQEACLLNCMPCWVWIFSIFILCINCCWVVYTNINLHWGCFNFVSLRESSTPTNSAVDLVLARGKAAAYSQTCSIKTSSPSDHVILELRLKPFSQQEDHAISGQKPIGIYMIETMDDLLSNISPPLLAQEIASLALLIGSALRNVIDIAVPTYTPRTKIAAWWTPNLTILRKKITQSKSRLRRSFSDEELPRWNKFETASSRAVRKAQSMYWDKRLSSINQSDIRKFIRRVAAHKKPIPPLLRCSDFEGKCNRLRTALFPPISRTPNPLPLLEPPFDDLTSGESVVTPKEASQILKHCQDGTAPGHDGISYKYIARLHQRLPLVLPVLYNSNTLTTPYSKGSWKNNTEQAHQTLGWISKELLVQRVLRS